MKTKRFTILVLTLGLFLNYSCQQEEKEVDIIQNSENENYSKKDIEIDISQNWQQADLTKVLGGKGVNYFVSINQLRSLVSKDNVKYVRFVPGVLSANLVLKLVSVDSDGKILNEILIKPTGRTPITKQLIDKVDITFNKGIVEDKTIAYHIIQPKDAYDYINNWNHKSMLDIDELTSFEGERIRYFSLESEVVSHIANLPIDYINISWGLNKKNKLTPVLIPLNNNSVQLSVNGRAESYLYDALYLCPNTCN